MIIGTIIVPILLALVSLVIVYIAADRTTKCLKENSIIADSTTDLVAPICPIVYAALLIFVSLTTALSLTFIIGVIAISAVAIIVTLFFPYDAKKKALQAAKEEKDELTRQWNIAHCKHPQVTDCVCQICRKPAHQWKTVGREYKDGYLVKIQACRNCSATRRDGNQQYGAYYR